MSSLVAPTGYGLFSAEGATLAGAIALFGGGFAWLFKQMTTTGVFRISADTGACLKKSVFYAVLSWVIGLAPVGLFRKLGWDRVQPMYQNLLYANPYTSFLTLVTPIILAACTVVLPAEKKSLKHKIWPAACLSAGVALAPAFMKPRDLITIAGGLTTGLVAPLAAAVAVSPNFVVLNIAAVLGMGMGTLFMQSTGIPWILERRHRDKASAALQSSFNSGVTSLALPSAIVSAFFLIVTVNAHVVFVEKCFRAKDKKESQDKKGDKKDEKKEDLKLFAINKWVPFDGTDEVTNGLLMASYAGFTFYKILSSVVRAAKKLASSQTKESKKEGSPKVSGFLQELLKM